jgi:hypothetical protein
MDAGVTVKESPGTSINVVLVVLILFVFVALKTCNTLPPPGRFVKEAPLIAGNVPVRFAALIDELESSRVPTSFSVSLPVSGALSVTLPEVAPLIFNGI